MGLFRYIKAPGLIILVITACFTQSVRTPSVWAEEKPLTSAAPQDSPGEIPIPQEKRKPGKHAKPHHIREQMSEQIKEKSSSGTPGPQPQPVPPGR